MSTIQSNFNIHPVQDTGTNAAWANYDRMSEANNQQRMQQQMQANMLQHAQALQVAKGQTSTPQSGMGTSPITQSVMKAKQLATSMLDQDNLSDQQKGILRDLTNDPNVDYKTHLQAIDQLRQSQQQAQHQGNFETKNSEMLSRQQQSAANQKQKMNLSSLSKQQSQAHNDMVALAKQMGGMGVDPDGPPNPDARLRALQEKYQAAKQGYSTAQGQIDEVHNHYGELPAGGTGDEDQQHGAEFAPDKIQNSRPDQPGYVSIKGKNPSLSGSSDVPAPGSAIIKSKGHSDVTLQNGQINQGQIREDQWQKVLDENGGDVDKARAAAESQGFNFAGGGNKQQGRGKISAQDAQQYIHKAGGNKDAARAMAKQDGWSF